MNAKTMTRNVCQTEFINYHHNITISVLQYNRGLLIGLSNQTSDLFKQVIEKKMNKIYVK